jgi:UDP-glucose 4-epimerase
VGRWAYAASKLRGEQLLDDADLWSPGAAAVHLRFFNVVGPGQDSDSGMVLPTFVENALAGAPIPVHGDGAAQRTFAHVDEVARVLRELVEHPALPGGALNVGGGARTTIAHLAQLVRAGSALKSELHYIDPRSLCGANFEEVAFRQPDLARLSTLGVALPAMGLERIVQDSLERHAGLCRQSSANPALKSPPCASPAS